MLELKTKIRQETGNKNKELRRQGFIPAVLYGHKIKNINLSINTADFEKLFKKAGETTLIKLKIEGDSEKNEKGRIVLIKDIARDAVTDQFIHADFQQIRMDKPITLEVPIVFIGESEAVEREKGVLIKNIQSIEIEAMPADIPHEIEADISILKTFDDNLCIKDLKIPEKVKTTADLEMAVASVIPPKTKEQIEAEEAELEQKPEESVEGVEVEKKGKEEAASEEKTEESKEEQTEA